MFGNDSVCLANIACICKGFLTGAEAENKRAGDNRKTDVEETGRK